MNDCIEEEEFFTGRSSPQPFQEESKKEEDIDMDDQS
jgi:hypothetical protein